jgi:hypothetical protein
MAVQTLQERISKLESEVARLKARTDLRISPTAVIRLRVKENPKVPGTGAWHLWNLYVDGMTVADYVKAVRAQAYRPSAAYVALRWDVQHDFITIGGER